MNLRAFWKFYRDFNLFNLIFSGLSAVFFGLFSALLIFVTFVLFIGYLGFEYFKSNDYYLYYNLGFNISYLIKKVWLLNLTVAAPFLVILSFFL